MYVCVCNVVTESQVRDAVKNGVRNMRELGAATGCSTTCGRCAKTAVEVLEASLRAEKSHLKVVSTGRAA